MTRPGGFSRAGYAVLLVMTVAVATCCVGVSSAATGIIRTIPVGGAPDGVASDGTHVWVANAPSGSVSEIEASNGTVIRTITLGGRPYGVSFDGPHVWVTNFDGTVSEIEASSGTVIRTIKLGGRPYGVSSDGTHVWVAQISVTSPGYNARAARSCPDACGKGGYMVFEIEASSGSVIRAIRAGLNPAFVSSDGTHVWVTILGENKVAEIEPSSGTVINKFRVGGWPRGVSSDGTHVWVANWASDTVSEVEASSATVIRTIRLGGKRPIGISSDGTHVWVTNSGEDKVTEIDASSGAVIHSIYGSFSYGVSSDGTHAWLVNFEEGTVSEIGATTVPNAECTGNTGTVTLSPGLTDAAAVQTLKIQGTLTGCAGDPFVEANYSAKLTTTVPVSCSVLKTAGETATGSAKYKWTPRARPSTGTLSLPLTEAPGIVFSGEVTTGPYSPVTFTATVTEHYGSEEGCARPITKGTFSGSAVRFE